MGSRVIDFVHLIPQWVIYIHINPPIAWVITETGPAYKWVSGWVDGWGPVPLQNTLQIDLYYSNIHYVYVQYMYSAVCIDIEISSLIKIGLPFHCELGLPFHCQLGLPFHCQLDSPFHCLLGLPFHCKLGLPFHCQLGLPFYCQLDSPFHCHLGLPFYCHLVAH